MAVVTERVEPGQPRIEVEDLLRDSLSIVARRASFGKRSWLAVGSPLDYARFVEALVSTWLSDPRVLELLDPSSAENEVLSLNLRLIFDPLTTELVQFLADRIGVDETQEKDEVEDWGEPTGDLVFEVLSEGGAGLPHYLLQHYQLRIDFLPEASGIADRIAELAKACAERTLSALIKRFGEVFPTTLIIHRRYVGEVTSEELYEAVLPLPPPPYVLKTGDIDEPPQFFVYGPRGPTLVTSKRPPHLDALAEGRGWITLTKAKLWRADDIVELSLRVNVTALLSAAQLLENVEGFRELLSILGAVREALPAAKMHILDSVIDTGFGMVKSLALRVGGERVEDVSVNFAKRGEMRSVARALLSELGVELVEERGKAFERLPRLLC